MYNSSLSKAALYNGGLWFCYFSIFMLGIALGVIPILRLSEQCTNTIASFLVACISLPVIVGLVYVLTSLPSNFVFYEKTSKNELSLWIHHNKKKFPIGTVLDGKANFFHEINIEVLRHFKKFDCIKVSSPEKTIVHCNCILLKIPLIKGG